MGPWACLGVGLLGAEKCPGLCGEAFLGRSGLSKAQGVVRDATRALRQGSEIMSPTQLVVKTEPGHLILAVDRYPVLNEAEEEELDRQGVANERLKELELREKEFLPESGPGGLVCALQIS